MQEFLAHTATIDFNHPEVNALALKLSENLTDDLSIAKSCFEYVRDQIKHSGDAQGGTPTCIASEVLRHKTGWCYAKSHLLAALLRANSIPTALCYQRLFCDEYTKESRCLHALNAIYLKDYGWYKVDARGNNKTTNAQFHPPKEQLAFELRAGEKDLEGYYAEPLECVLQALKQDYKEMIHHFPDMPCT